MRRVIRLGACLLLAALTGCAGDLRHSAQAAVAADGLSTVAGVASGLTREANPLITSPAGLLASVAVRLAAIEYVHGKPEPQRTTGLASLNTLTWGVAASNVAVMAAHSNPLGIVAGIAVGWYVWHSTANERAFAKLCADGRLAQPELQCIYHSR